MKHKHTPKYLPHEIIENILSRLPVKSLLRFKAVCKQWKATISDPEFAETHLRCSSRSRLISSQHPFTRLRLKNNEFRPLSASNHQPLKSSSSTIYCHCDGLYLISCEKGDHANKYVLWNPSRRRYKKLRYPYPVYPKSISISGICYDPLVKDYKVVIGDAEYYAVFYCKTKSWSETKETNLDCDIPCSDGIPFNGSIYWVFFSKHEDCFEIVYFDGRDEKLKNVNKLDGFGDVYPRLISSRDALYVFPFQHWATRDIRFMKKVVGGGGGDDAWREIRVQLPSFCHYVIPLSCTEENTIILEVNFKLSWGTKYLLYDEGKRSLAKIQNYSDLVFNRLFPYVENLFLL